MLGALIGGAFIVALGVLAIHVQRSAESGPFDMGTTIVIVLYLAFPLLAVAAAVILLYGLTVRLTASVSAAVKWRTKRRHFGCAANIAGASHCRFDGSPRLRIRLVVCT